MKKKLINHRVIGDPMVKRIGLIMKWTSFLLLAFILNVNGKGFAQDVRVNLDLHEAKLLDIFKEIKNQTDYTFFYRKTDLDVNERFSVKYKNISLKEVIKNILGDRYSVDYKMNMVLITPKVSNDKEKNIVKGTVKDKKGNSLPGVSVVIKGTTVGVSTDVNGNFEIVCAEKNTILVFSFIGMKEKEMKIEGNKKLSITLEDEEQNIEEVVVTGYFQRKKDSYTGAITTFKGEELRQISTGNVLSALSSIDPSFTQMIDNNIGSDPNKMHDFVIRGAGSLKSEYEGNPNSPTFIMDGFEVTAEKIFDLDPSRVRSITILKDAAATAIYGSRAANGVVVIETEIPKMGELRVSYIGSMNLDVADLSGYNLMKSKDKFQFEQNAGIYKPGGSRPEWDETSYSSFNAIQKLVSKGIDTDWMSIPVRDVGVGQKHTFILEGGDSKFRYSFDVNYSDKVGVMKESGRKGMGIGIKLQYNYKKFKFVNYLSFDNVKSKNSPFGNYSQYSYLNPYYYPYNEDGSISQILYEYSYYDRGFTSKKMYNGLYNTTLPVKDESRYNDFTNNFSVEYDIIQGLKFKSKVSITNKQTRTDKYLPNDHISFIDKEYKGSYELSNRDYFSYDINAVLSYTKTIDKHLLNAVGVFNISEKEDDFSKTIATNFPNQHLDHIGMGTDYKKGSRPSGNYIITRLMGVVGNINYSYDSKYLLDISVRNDASSLFGANNRWGTFGSIGLGWNLHNESFMNANSIFKVLKLRGSWGLTGGQNFYAYQALAMLSYTEPGVSDAYDDNIGAVLKALGNENLKWQRTEKRNIGVDFETQNRMFSGYVNLYSDISKDVLVDVSLAPSLGFKTYKENLGEVKNSGIEINLRTKIINNKETGLHWDVYGNIVKNVNELMSINNALTEFNKQQDSDVGNKTKIRYMQGESINTIWANESIGIDPATGREIFLDMNNNVTDTWSVDNYKPLGNMDPKFYGNFGTHLMYKNIELNASFLYSYGGDVYNKTLVDKIENIDPNENGDIRILTDKWQKPGDVAKYIGYDANNPTFTRPTSRFIERENYIQLKSLSLSYQLKQNTLKKLGIERLKISAIGNDIFRMSTVEMERGINYPFARTYSLSLQVTL